MIEAEDLRDCFLDKDDKEEVEEYIEVTMDAFLGEGEREWLDKGGMDTDKTVDEDEIVPLGLARETPIQQQDGHHL